MIRRPIAIRDYVEILHFPRLQAECCGAWSLASEFPVIFRLLFRRRRAVATEDSGLNINTFLQGSKLKTSGLLVYIQPLSKKWQYICISIEIRAKKRHRSCRGRRPVVSGLQVS